MRPRCPVIVERTLCRLPLPSDVVDEILAFLPPLDPDASADPDHGVSITTITTVVAGIARSQSRVRNRGGEADGGD